MIPAGRVFAALRPPPEISQALAAALASPGLPGRPVPSENYHVTLRYLGRVDDHRYEHWLSRLEALPRRGSIRVRLEGLGAFPGWSRAQVVWVGVSAPGIEELAATVEEATVAAGFPPEERPYRPHLTVARIRPPRPLPPLPHPRPRLGWEADRMVVMAAVGSRYRVFESFSL